MIVELSAAEISRQLTSRGLSAVEVAKAFLERIEAADSSLGAFLRAVREMRECGTFAFAGEAVSYRDITAMFEAMTFGPDNLLKASRA